MAFVTNIRYDSLMLKTIFSHCEGSQKCFFHVLYVSAVRLSDHLVTEQQQAERKNGDICSLTKMTFFSVKSVLEQIES